MANPLRHTDAPGLTRTGDLAFRNRQLPLPLEGTSGHSDPRSAPESREPSPRISPTGLALRAAGQAVAVSHCDVGPVLEAIARRTGCFTADDVRASLTDGQRETFDAFPNAFSAAFTYAAKLGLIEDTHQVVRSQRPESRARRIAVWRRAA